MRAIKFRAWKFSTVTDTYKFVYFTVSDLLSAIGVIQAADKLYNLEDCPVMQYTGLKDKNGNEIYEGDIVQCEVMGGKNVGEIVENRGAFWWKGKVLGGVEERPLHEEYCDCGQSGTWPYEYEVIGNIHKNPELLRPEQQGGAAT